MSATVSQVDVHIGNLVRLWPYEPGAYGRDTLYRVWKLMEDDQATRDCFWDEANLETGADLGSFIQAFEGVASKQLLMIERCDTGMLCGCFWVAQIQPNHQAFVSMWMHKDARGPMSGKAAHMALNYTFTRWNLMQVFAMTPWASAGTLCKMMGFTKTAVLPDFCKWTDGSMLPVSLYRLTKEGFDGLSLTKRV
mgnify:CR=1 FL=1